MKHPKKVSKHIINWINTYLENSKINGLVVGVSGGVDSALTSTLCAETGKKLICIEMPIKQEDAQISRAKKPSWDCRGFDLGRDVSGGVSLGAHSRRQHFFR